MAARIAAFVIVSGTATVVASCQPQNIPQPSSSPTSSSSQSPTPQPVALKPVLAGFLDRNTVPPASFIPVMGGWVVNVNWADIQPAQGAPIASPNAIDAAIATLHQIDPSGRRMGLKVRVFAGIHAPEWAKSLGGPPIMIEDPTSGATGTIGRFWTDDFGAAYSGLQAKLAAMYDSAPEIREITISRCTTVYAEPFIRDASSSITVPALVNAGFTVDADQRCHREEVVAHQVWIHTRSDLSFNPYQNLGGGPVRDEAFTETMMSFCRSTLGARCVLENNSLRVPPIYADMYAAMQADGPPIAFQTAVLAKVGLGGIVPTIQYAISLGAASVELPAGYQNLPVATLTAGYIALVADAGRSAA